MRPDLEEGDETHAAVGAVRIVCDDVRPSIFESQLIASAQQGWILSAARSHRALAILELRRGALLSAEAHARASWEILATRRDASAALYWWSAAVLVDVLIARGALDEADTIAMSTGLGTTPMDQVIFPWPPVLLGELELARGNTEAGVEILLAAGDWLEQHGVTNPSFIPWRALAAPALIESRPCRGSPTGDLASRSKGPRVRCAVGTRNGFACGRDRRTRGAAGSHCCRRRSACSNDLRAGSSSPTRCSSSAAPCGVHSKGLKRASTSAQRSI